MHSTLKCLVLNAWKNTGTEYHSDHIMVVAESKWWIAIRKTSWKQKIKHINVDQVSGHNKEWFDNID